MALDRPRNDGDPTHPGEPGVGIDLAPPFTAEDEPTRWLFGLNRFGIRPGLARIRGLLDDLGNPERDLRTLVVTGTNGKGGTTRVLAGLLGAAGHRVAAYTSPHLLNVRERILIDDRPLPAGEFADRVTAIRPLVEKHEASWFETLTALAVQAARDHGVDFLCCETGLGGRLDASNALPAEALLLTTVALDHQRILGETLAEIAAEKLGLLKPGVPLFCGVEEGLRIQIFQAAVRAGSPCHFLDELARWEDSPGPRAASAVWRLILTDRVVEGLPEMGGGVMRRNVALAVLALSRLEAAGADALLPADIPGVLRNLFLPGRYHRVLERPDWIFDTAHNPQALSLLLDDFTRDRPAGRNVLLFGAMYDKEMPPELAPRYRRFDAVVGAPVSLPRSRTAPELADLFRQWGLKPEPWSGGEERPGGRPVGLPPCTVAPDLAAAVGRLAVTLEPNDRVLVTGSCFTVAETLYTLGFTDLAAVRRPLPAGKILAASRFADRGDGGKESP